jgi:hypothetical protein
VESGAVLTHKVEFDPDGIPVWIAQSTEATPVGTYVGLYVEPENIQVMRKSGWNFRNAEKSDEENGDVK